MTMGHVGAKFMLELGGLLATNEAFKNKFEEAISDAVHNYELAAELCEEWGKEWIKSDSEDDIEFFYDKLEKWVCEQLGQGEESVR